MLNIYSDQTACRKLDLWGKVCRQSRSNDCSNCPYEGQIYADPDFGMARKYLVYWLGYGLVSLCLSPFFPGRFAIPMTPGSLIVPSAVVNVIAALVPVFLIMMLTSYFWINELDARLLVKQIQGRSGEVLELFRLVFAIIWAAGFAGCEFIFTGHSGAWLLLAFYGAAVGFHHAQTWCNWKVVRRCTVIYPLL